MSGRNGCCVETPQKRQAILEQAIRTFAELGFRGTDVQVIADRAAVGKGTVYRYFHSKEDLFWAATLDVLVRLEKFLAAAIVGVEGTSAQLRAAAVAHADFFGSNPQYLEMFVQERAEFRGAGPQSHRDHHEMMIERFGRILQQGIESGELRPVDARQTTLALGCLLYGATVLGSHLQSVPVPQLSEFAVDIFLAGLRAENPNLVGESQSEHRIN
jgi:AcrR family transcriptional regulator